MKVDDALKKIGQITEKALEKILMLLLGMMKLTLKDQWLIV
tara:strand:- start:169 stop:291 length:123 start_codon:yes stop_codon:yes gene_type:complete